MPEYFRERFKDMLLRLWVILQVYPSDHEVNVEEYRAVCLQTKLLILTELNGPSGKQWIYLTPTVHALLTHSHELIIANEGRGLKCLSEEGLEHNNKFLRFYIGHFQGSALKRQI